MPVTPVSTPLHPSRDGVWSPGLAPFRGTDSELSTGVAGWAEEAAAEHRPRNGKPSQDAMGGEGGGGAASGRMRKTAGPSEIRSVHRGLSRSSALAWPDHPALSSTASTHELSSTELVKVCTRISETTDKVRVGRRGKQELSWVFQTGFLFRCRNAHI